MSAELQFLYSHHDIILNVDLSNCPTETHAQCERCRIWTQACCHSSKMRYPEPPYFRLSFLTVHKNFNTKFKAFFITKLYSVHQGKSHCTFLPKLLHVPVKVSLSLLFVLYFLYYFSHFQSLDVHYYKGGLSKQNILMF